MLFGALRHTLAPGPHPPRPAYPSLPPPPSRCPPPSCRARPSARALRRAATTWPRCAASGRPPRRRPSAAQSSCAPASCWPRWGPAAWQSPLFDTQLPGVLTRPSLPASTRCRSATQVFAAVVPACLQAMFRTEVWLADVPLPLRAGGRRPGPHDSRVLHLCGWPAGQRPAVVLLDPQASRPQQSALSSGAVWLPCHGCLSAHPGPGS